MTREEAIEFVHRALDELSTRCEAFSRDKDAGSAFLCDRSRERVLHAVYRYAIACGGSLGDPPTFDQMWDKYKERGYQYGEDALDNLRFGWRIREEAQLVNAEEGL